MPVLGYLDDVVIVPAGIALAIRLIPPEVMSGYGTPSHAFESYRAGIVAYVEKPLRLDALCEAVDVHLPADRSPAQRLFQRAYTLLDEQPGLSLLQLARILAVHPRSLARIVRQETGLRASVWRTQVRGQRSAALLRGRPDMLVKEIAWLLGFRSTSAFDRFVRRTLGSSPKDVRKQRP